MGRQAGYGGKQQGVAARWHYRLEEGREEEARGGRTKRAHCGLGDHGLMGSWRKAYGALKDSTTVGLAKVNSEFKVSHGDGDPISVDSKLSSTDFCGF